MRYEELMAGADTLNAYYSTVGTKSQACVEAATMEVIDSYERLLSDYAEMAGCYAEWEERRSEGLEEA